MIKKDYSSPDCEVIRIQLVDALLTSVLHPNDPQDPTRAGSDGDDEFELP